MSCVGTTQSLSFSAISALNAVLLRSHALCISRCCLQDGWCQFDLFVVAMSIAGVAVDMATAQNLEFLPLIRVMRVARVFRLIPKAQGLR